MLCISQRSFKYTFIIEAWLKKKSLPSGFFSRYTPVNNIFYFYPHDIKTCPIKSQWAEECLIRCVYLVTSSVQTKYLEEHL